MFLPSIGDVSIGERKVSDKCEDSLVETHPASTEISLWSLRHHPLRDLRHNLTSLALIITLIWSSHHRCHWCQHHGLVRSGTMGEGVVAPPSEGSRGQDGGVSQEGEGRRVRWPHKWINLQLSCQNSSMDPRTRKRIRSCTPVHPLKANLAYRNRRQ